MFATLKALSHDAIFLATCNAILLLRDVELANTRLHSNLLMYSSEIKHSILINIFKSRIALQVARQTAPCDSALTTKWKLGLNAPYTKKT